jgi:hypothetical protein
MNKLMLLTTLIFSSSVYAQMPLSSSLPETVTATPQTAPTAPVVQAAPVAPAPPPAEPPPSPITEAEPAPTTFFYYCERTKTYFPNVQTCPTGWIAVPAGAAIPAQEQPQMRPWPAPVHRYSVNAPEIVHSQPNVVSFEFFGRALLYSVNYDFAVSDHLSLGIGISSWESRDWWTSVDSSVTVVPIYGNYYFSQHLGRGYISLGADWISVSSIGNNSNTFANNGMAAVIGGGYEARDASGYLLRFGGYVIAGKTTTINPSVSVGYAF